jgi:SAM-dependent methyltransferase
MPSGDRLQCLGCAQQYPVRDGAPRFTTDSTDTAMYFGYIWGLQETKTTPPTTTHPYHLSLMYDRLGGKPLEGLILDGGCGDGVDLAMQALNPAVEIVGLELSNGGVATSLARTRGMSRAHVVQGDLLRVPFASETFDGAYSYGVVHHTPNPGLAVKEIARTLKPGAHLLLYVYEDFADRPWYWRAALAIANAPRAVTTRMPPRMLMGLCRILAPIIYVTCSIPSRHFSWAANFPYRHNTRIDSGMVGDIYDRLSAPIEYRYSKESAAMLATDAGLSVITVAQERGWMVRAVKTA